MFFSKLPLARNQQCKITLSHFKKSALCCKLRTQVILSYQTQYHSRETSEAESKMQTHSLFLPREERRPGSEKTLNKNVIVISVIAQRCEILCTVLGRWTSKLHTPLKLTNWIRYKLKSWVNAPWMLPRIEKSCDQSHDCHTWNIR